MGRLMEILNLPVDYGFPFASGLVSLRNKNFGTSVEDFKALCKELTEGYHCKVACIGDIPSRVGTCFFKVTEDMNEVRIDWISEVLHYHKPVGVEVVLVKSNEPVNTIKYILHLKFNLKIKLRKHLEEGKGRILFDNEGVSLVRNALIDSVMELPNEIDIAQKK